MRLRAHLGLAIVCLGAVLSPFDTTVNTAFPAIGEAFGLGVRDLQWVVIPYVLAQAVVSLIAGDIGDRIGHRRVFAIGLGACAIAHWLIANAPDWPTLVALRVVQGIAVGTAVACAPALATLLYPPEQKARALAAYAAVFSAAMAFGPWLGGLLLDAYGWRGTFGFRTPLALLALLLLPWLRVGRPARLGTDDTSAAMRARFGGLGALRRPVFASLQFASVALNAACFANLLLGPWLLVRDAGVALSLAGAVLSAYPTGAVLGNLAAGRLIARVSPQRLVATGLAIASLGLAAVAAVVARVGGLPALDSGAFPLALLALAMAMNGVGLGLFQVGYMDLTTSWMPLGNRGTAGSLANVTRLLGLMVGAAGIGALREANGSDATSFAWLALGSTMLAAAWPAIARRARTRSG